MKNETQTPTHVKMNHPSFPQSLHTLEHQDQSGNPSFWPSQLNMRHQTKHNKMYGIHFQKRGLQGQYTNPSQVHLWKLMDINSSKHSIQKWIKISHMFAFQDAIISCTFQKGSQKVWTFLLMNHTDNLTKVMFCY